MVEILPDHGHCLTCDEPVDVGMDYCSDLCKEKYQRDRKREKDRNFIFFAAVAVLFVVLTLATFLLR